MTVRIFVDFDGTVTREDVGNAFFHAFGGERCDEIVRTYRAGRISAADCFTLEAEAMGEFRRSDAEAFARSCPIDESFASLVSFARVRGYDLTVVSDGLDFYLREILGANGLAEVRFFGNQAEFVPGSKDGNSRLRLAFPFSDAECTRCACCKRNLMLTRSSDEDIIVLVGEGYSDTCPASYADVVFAKKDLRKFCQAQNISYFPYGDFQDVVRRLETLTKHGKPLRKRVRAELHRRAAFKAE